ncbi:triacylglycerol lipase [Boletus edulis BED1]|uniref:Triacylglycerol lipase n=1 Tax=Boletus edulis BED1 TaxID=1328754 RepID=A0AAD4C5L8_BOLED|nr:triacylglycerol lipase [Boletus edulis BED1]
MAHIPLIGRLSFKEYIALLVGFSILGIETLLRFTVLLLPKPVVAWFYTRSQVLFDRFASAQGTQTTEEAFASAIRSAKDFGELVALYGYAHEEHVVLTKDGYLLTLHRIPRRKGEDTAHCSGADTKKPAVYLHHGLLMNSEVWVCLTDEAHCLPFVLAEQGFDVWLGNNRGNKYSKKSIHHRPSSSKFWNYSLDEFAWHDIPDSIEYILARTGAGSLGYVGFSQGTAQAFAALSVNPQLNEKVNVLVALAPAMSPAGLATPIVDALMKASPTSVYLFFGRKAILSSVATWQAIIYPPIFTSIIDTALYFLFSWDSRNITTTQKTAAYAHLYSYASVKSVVHWFQIMRESTFQMFDDDVAVFGGPANSGKAYRPARFPTRNIETPILLLYGNRDSLMDIEAMVSALPASGTRMKKLEGYEHLDVLWGKDIDKDVFPEVVNALRMHCDSPAGAMHNGVKVFEMGADSKEPEE